MKGEIVEHRGARRGRGKKRESMIKSRPMFSQNQVTDYLNFPCSLSVCVYACVCGCIYIVLVFRPC